MGAYHALLAILVLLTAALIGVSSLTWLLVVLKAILPSWYHDGYVCMYLYVVISAPVHIPVTIPVRAGIRAPLVCAIRIMVHSILLVHTYESIRGILLDTVHVGM